MSVEETRMAHGFGREEGRKEERARIRREIEPVIAEAVAEFDRLLTNDLFRRAPELFKHATQVRDRLERAIGGDDG